MWFKHHRSDLAWGYVVLVSAFSQVNAIVLPRQSSAPSSLKAGLGWGGGGNISQFEGHQVGWYYTWAPTSWVSPPPRLEYVPQLWGTRDAALFASQVNTSSITSNGWKHVLGMNEPQEPTQSNLSPQDGAALWRTYLEPLKSAGVRLGSPATTSAPNSKTWIQDFLAACNGGCSVDFIALHWYGNVAAEFIAYLEDYHNTFQRPIWVTEWSCLNFIGGAQCTYDEMVQFMNTTQTYMDQTEWVERYAWFGAMANLPTGINNFTALMDPTGVINPLGQQYIGPVAGTTPSTTPSSTFIPVTSTIPTTSFSTSATDTTLTTTLTTTINSQSTSISSAAISTTSSPPYVIINGAASRGLKTYLEVLIGTLIVWGLLAL